MFAVKTYLDKSTTHGIGLFANENIEKGSLVYIVNPQMDLHIKDEDFKSLSDDEKETIRHFGYKSKNGEWHLSFDNIRFCNHSQLENNIGIGKNGNLHALRNIVKNEELLQDYAEFEELRESLKCN